MNTHRIWLTSMLCHAMILFFSAFAHAAEPSSLIDTRLDRESLSGDNRFSILPHKPNYILPLSYNIQPNQAPWRGFGAGQNPVQSSEVKFQISIKIPLANNLFTEHDALFAAYTQKSFWQAYNKKISSPFRDNNFNPELFYRMKLDRDIAGMNVRILSLGFEHESNGRTEPLSRSWNRVYAKAVAEYGNIALALKVWYRIPEKTSSDNNPDISNYLGNEELHALYRYGHQTFGVMFRPGLRSGFTPGIQLDWSFPLTKRLQGYVQYYSGYGENLIDYNHYNHSIGIGIMLNNWL